MSVRKKISWITYLFLSLTSLLVLAGIGFLVLIAFGMVAGDEFSPDDFSRRHFDYIRIPGLNWVVRGIEYHDITTDFEKNLGIDGWISTTSPKTWHLYREAQVLQPAECDARFLVEMLQKKSDSNEYQYFWEQWTQEHPKLAKVFWPVIARMARDELYLAIPEIMQLAMQVDRRTEGGEVPSAEDFEVELKQKLAAAYKKFGELDQANGRTERSQARLKSAAEFQTE